MKGFLNNRRVSCTLSALCFIALGVFLVFWPELSRIWICRLLGAALLVSGGVYVVSHFARAKGAAAVFQYDLILGAVLAVVGVWLLTTPDLIVAFLQYILGLILIVVIVLLAVFGPGMNSYTYSGQDLSQKNFAPRVPGIERLGILDGSEKMSTTTGSKSVNAYVEKGKDDVYYWFGSDLYGRDIWTRTWEGARVSLIIAVAAAVIDMVIGMSYGLISGYFGGRVDMVMQRFLEVANGIPRLVIVTLLLLVLQPGMVTIIFALMLTEWVGMSRIARAEMLKLKDQEFVLASRTLGAGSFFIIFKEVLPNIIGPIITQVMFSIPTAIFTEAFLSFVGLGIPVPQCSLGSLISELYNSFTTHPYQIIPPIVVMSLLMLSFNLVADGLREALDPKMKSM